jgi:hypothetical protein
MSKGIMSILVISSCLNVLVWICAHALLYEVVRFQVPSSKVLALRGPLVLINNTFSSDMSV